MIDHDDSVSRLEQQIDRPRDAARAVRRRDDGSDRHFAVPDGIRPIPIDPLSEIVAGLDEGFRREEVSIENFEEWEKSRGSS